MKSICSRKDFSNDCGDLEEEIIQVCTKTYPFLLITDTDVYFKFDLLSIFSEQIDLFSVDPSMISDIFILNHLFGDESVSPDVIMIVTSIIERVCEDDAESIHEDGYFWLTFSEIRTWYGEDRFDVDMKELFPIDYENFKEYLLE